MRSAKNDVESLWRRLPNDCTLEDIQYHLYVLEKIRRGLAVADTQGTLTQEEGEQRLRQWMTAARSSHDLAGWRRATARAW